MLFDADGEIAQHIFVEPFLALDFVERGRRRIDIEQRDVRLAVFANAVGEGLQAPIFVLGDLAAELSDHALYTAWRTLRPAARSGLGARGRRVRTAT